MIINNYSYIKIIFVLLIFYSGITSFFVKSESICSKHNVIIKNNPQYENYYSGYKYKNWRGADAIACTEGVRLVDKVSQYTVIEKYCCDGYAQQGHKTEYSLTCVPVCDEICLNGKCTAPNVCTCANGYELKENSKFECKPKCNNCNHGTCIAPDFCDCYPDFKKSDNETCIPICHNECINGFCSAPEICSCNDGYYLNETINNISSINKTDQKIICQPHCNENCENGYCSEPNICTCNDGYKKKSNNISSNICIPKCFNDCENGICIGPDHCICNPGFEMNKIFKKCIPICTNGCLNGNCTEPEICTCNDGFKMKSKSISICEPDCNPECEYGEFCNEPNECRCAIGYKKNFITNKCQPNCSPECINSDCINPYECKCWNGYEKDINILNKCNPICYDCNDDDDICISPNLCLRKPIETTSITTELITQTSTEFDYSYDEINKEIIENFTFIFPINNENKNENEEVIIRESRKWNDNTCINENCTINGICLNETCYCDNGYSGINCPNFCENKCKNGYCFNSDGSCNCFSDHFFNNEYDDSINYSENNCDTFCNTICTNISICILPIECNCIKGYIKNEIGLCVPKCYKEKILENNEIEIRSKCVNGICIAPNICECNDIKNQILDPENDFICINNNSIITDKNILKTEQIPSYLYNLWIACLILLVLAGIIVLSIIIYKKQKDYNVDKKEKEFGAYRYADGAVTYDDPNL